MQIWPYASVPLAAYEEREKLTAAAVQTRQPLQGTKACEDCKQHAMYNALISFFSLSFSFDLREENPWIMETEEAPEMCFLFFF